MGENCLQTILKRINGKDKINLNSKAYIRKKHQKQTQA